MPMGLDMNFICRWSKRSKSSCRLKGQILLCQLLSRNWLRPCSRLKKWRRKPPSEDASPSSQPAPFYPCNSPPFFHILKRLNSLRQAGRVCLRPIPISRRESKGKSSFDALFLSASISEMRGLRDELQHPSAPCPRALSPSLILSFLSAAAEAAGAKITDIIITQSSANLLVLPP